MTEQLHPLDWLVIGTYVLIIIILGLSRSKQNRSSPEQFILAGRKLSLPAFVATLVATWYGGILGIGENIYLYGIQTWFIFGLPYYLFAILFSLFLVDKIRSKKTVSIPDHFRNHYDEKTGILSAVLILILASPAPYILSLGILINFLAGIPLSWALLAAAGVSLSYTWFGGFNSVVKTDLVQFFLMFAGFGLLLYFSWIKIGPPSVAFANLPETHFNPLGGQGTGYVMVWFFIALWTFIDPGFHQRTSAANSSKTARNGILIAVAFWFIFDMMTLMTGLYAKSLITTSEPMFAFVLLAQSGILPPAILGVFLSGLLATLMSTVDSLGFISAMTFGRDILWRIKSPEAQHPEPKNQGATHYTQSGLVVVGFLAVLLAFSIPSVIKLWFTIGTIIIPGLLVPFLITFTSIQIQSRFTSFYLILPPAASAIWLVGGSISSHSIFTLEAFYPGVFLSIILTIIFRESTQ